MRTDDVLTERHGGTLLITLNRRERRNAVDESLTEGLAAALDVLEGDPDLQAGVLTGAPPGFCAGMDLRAFVEGERAWHPDRGFAGIVRDPGATPLIAAVEGFAVAGGLEIALACDVIVAARGARLGVPEVQRGLVATGGALLRLPARIGPGAAMRLALTGELIDADEGHRLGLVDELCAPGEAVETAMALAQRIAANGPLAVAVTKRILSEAPGWGEEAWERQDAVAAPVLASEDAREGAVAFAEKRPPCWRGR
jgi:enoyl-CoA hydratase